MGCVSLINIVLTPLALAPIPLSRSAYAEDTFARSPARQNGGLNDGMAAASFIIISCNFANGDYLLAGHRIILRRNFLARV